MNLPALATEHHQVAPLGRRPGKMDARLGLWKRYVTGDGIFNSSRQEQAPFDAGSDALWLRLKEEKQEIKGVPAMVEQNPTPSHLRIQTPPGRPRRLGT